MSKENLCNSNRDVTGEACAWIAQLESGELTRADRDAFREWMQRSPRHVSEIKRIGALSGELNVLTEMAAPISQASAHYQSIFRCAKEQPLWRMVAVTGIVGVATIVLVARGLLLDSSSGLQEASFATAIGEQREVELIDGTTMLVNTDSALRVNYTRGVRRVELLRGEAYFDVESDAARPFIVESNGRRVRAVGTTFAVKAIGANLTVTVVEGQVELSGLNSRSSADVSIGNDDVLLDAGKRLTAASLAGEVSIIHQTPIEQERSLSWQEGIHDFSSTPLEDVVREISRYSMVEIEIIDPALRELEFGGIFPVGDTRPLLDALETRYGIEVERVGTTKVLLSMGSKRDTVRR